ncbi:DUF202 domain-containing protein [Mycobacterium sp. 852013-50091_SCH5140682]|uniref:DUF202 domain-containing protein n=1 Tax=Mycobacterium sp. 852013-50091_SCH5140682 TaxID=1834109 RepID=UPI0009EDDA9A
MSASRARDPGLQPERTALAWRRTVLTAAGVALICARLWLEHHALWMLLTTIMVSLTVCVTSLGLIVRRRSCHHSRDVVPPATCTLALTSMSVAAAGGASVVALFGS